MTVKQRVTAQDAKEITAPRRNMLNFVATTQYVPLPTAPLPTAQRVASVAIVTQYKVRNVLK